MKINYGSSRMAYKQFNLALKSSKILLIELIFFYPTVARLWLINADSSNLGNATLFSFKQNSK